MPYSNYTLSTLFLVLMGVLLAAGCGTSSPTMAEMKRRAIKRTTAAEEEEELRKFEEAKKARKAAEAAAKAEAAGTEGGDSTSATTQSPAKAATDKPVAASQPSDTPPANTPADTTPKTSSGAPTSTTRKPPAQPLTAEARLAMSRENLEKIGAALNAYVKKNRTLPPAGITPRGARTPNLSWRVELLPYLGLQDLYDAFNKDEPWDSPGNRKLLALIPAAYQSPERFDERTNYLAVAGSSVAFGDKRGVRVANVEDGLRNTAVVVEVDDNLATPWTKPSELRVKLNEPAVGLGSLRDSGFIALSGTGIASWVPLPLDVARLKSAFTVDAGESTGLSDVSGDFSAVGEIASSETPASQPANPTRAQPGTTPPPGTPTRPATTVAASGRPTARPADAGHQSAGGPYTEPTPTRKPIPNGSELRRARQLFREIYKDEYAEAQEKADKRKFARKLLDTLSEVRDDPASHYVLMDIIREIAVQSDDADTAIEVIDELCSTFEVKRHDMRQKTVSSFLQTGRDGRSRSSKSSDLMRHAVRYSEEALRDEDLAAAEELCNLAIAAMRDNDDDELIERLTTRRDMISDHRAAKRAADDALERLEKNPNDGPSNVALGRYLCFYKGDWENGLPILQQGSSGGLKKAVDLEFANPTDPQALAEVGEVWWDRSESAKPAERIAMRRRALDWYARAMNGLPGGLLKVKIQKRMDDFEEEEQERQNLLSDRRRRTRR